MLNLAFLMGVFVRNSISVAVHTWTEPTSIFVPAAMQWQLFAPYASTHHSCRKAQSSTRGPVRALRVRPSLSFGSSTAVFVSKCPPLPHAIRSIERLLGLAELAHGSRGSSAEHKHEGPTLDALDTYTHSCQHMANRTELELASQVGEPTSLEGVPQCDTNRAWRLTILAMSCAASSRKPRVTSVFLDARGVWHCPMRCWLTRETKKHDLPKTLPLMHAMALLLKVALHADPLRIKSSTELPCFGPIRRTLTIDLRPRSLPRPTSASHLGRSKLRRCAPLLKTARKQRHSSLNQAVRRRAARHPSRHSV